jgi:hypothetical protein
MKKVEVSPALARKVAANTAAISDTREDICYIVDGDQSEVTIPSGSIFRLINSTVTGRSDGLYTSAAAIPASTSIDATYFNESAPLSGGVSNLLNSNFTTVTKDFTQNIAANDNVNLLFGDVLPNSYKPISFRIIEYSTMYGDFVISPIQTKPSDGKQFVQVRNISSSTQKLDCTLEILCMKS